MTPLRVRTVIPDIETDRLGQFPVLIRRETGEFDPANPSEVSQTTHLPKLYDDGYRVDETMCGVESDWRTKSESMSVASVFEKSDWCMDCVRKAFE